MQCEQRPQAHADTSAAALNAAARAPQQKPPMRKAPTLKDFETKPPSYVGQEIAAMKKGTRVKQGSKEDLEEQLAHIKREAEMDVRSVLQDMWNTADQGVKQDYFLEFDALCEKSLPPSLSPTQPIVEEKSLPLSLSLHVPCRLSFCLSHLSPVTCHPSPFTPHR
jgi:hypothetical protein